MLITETAVYDFFEKHKYTLVSRDLVKLFCELYPSYSTEDDPNAIKQFHERLSRIHKKIKGYKKNKSKRGIADKLKSCETNLFPAKPTPKTVATDNETSVIRSDLDVFASMPNDEYQTFKCHQDFTKGK